MFKSLTALALAILFVTPMALGISYLRIELGLSRIKCLVAMITWGLLVGFVISYFWQYV